jgi:hypothetical protein
VELQPICINSLDGSLLGQGNGSMSIKAKPGQVVIVKIGKKSYQILTK